MRPGELIAADRPTPAASGERRGHAELLNTGRFPAYVGSHTDLSQLSEALELDRARLAGARLDIAAGSSVRIAPGESVELAVVWD